MKTIHMMQCMYMHKMCTVMHGIKNRLKLLPGKEFTNIATDSKKKMTALNMQMLQCLPIHVKQVICQKF